jgi:broad specificity phosphatase PhoE
VSQIYFIRHAQASYLSANYDQLSPLGEEQSTILGQYLCQTKVHFDKVFVGPLVRQQQTQQLVAQVFERQNMAFQTPILLHELAEHLGPGALRHLKPILASRDAKVKHWEDEMTQNPELKRRNSLYIFEHFMEQWVSGQITDADHLYEPWEAFRARVRRGLEVVLSSVEKGETVGVFTSGGVVSAVVAEVLRLPNEAPVAQLNYAVRNTSMSQFLFSKNNLTLLSFNEVPHLSQAQITFV